MQELCQQYSLWGNSHLGLKTMFYSAVLKKVIQSICALYYDNEEERMGDKWRVLL